MALLNRILRKKDGKKGEAIPTTGRKEKDADREAAIVSSEARPMGAVSPVVLSSHLTEKTTISARQHKYIFVVSEDANKIEVRKAIERQYGVNVTGVNMVRTHGKVRRRGRQIGWKPGMKKAVVTLAEGQRIDTQ